MSYHKYNELQREQVVLRRLKQGDVVALISDAGMPGISDPGMELVSVFLHANFLLSTGFYIFCRGERSFLKFLHNVENCRQVRLQLLSRPQFLTLLTTINLPWQL